MAGARWAPGTVIRYPYLWKREYERGEASGRKDRPACLAITVSNGGLTYLYLLPISSHPPARDQVALEIPAIELRRVGLKSHKRGWITVSEHNRDIAERSFFLDIRAQPLGTFSEAFLLKIQRAALPFFRSASARVARR